VAELADRVAQRPQAEDQGERHDEQAPDQVSIIHGNSDEVAGVAGAAEAPRDARQ
jgi:hypothetical protein